MLLDTEPVVCAPEIEAEAALPDSAKTAAPRASGRQPVRVQLPAGLPREVRVVKLHADLCRCRQCGEEKAVIGYEKSERLNVRPAVYYVLETLREKRACRKCEELGVSVAPVPPSIVEKGILGDELVVDVILRKFCDHNPLYRQAVGLERDADLEVSQSTLGAATLRAGELLQSVSAAMRQELFAGGYIQADETPVPVRSERTKGRNHQGYLWEYGRPGGPVVYDFRMGRERAGPAAFLAHFEGKLQHDGYAAYDKIGGPALVRFGCWAHARRKFHDAWKLDKGDAHSAVILEAVGRLYAVESEAREGDLDAVGRGTLRATRSIPVLMELERLIVRARAAALPQSTLGKACNYALGQWASLGRYAIAGHGIVEIDNNWAENAMRGVALGRKNWLHVGSEAAGPRIAALYSVLESCKRLGINPREYLGDVLPRLADWSMSRIAELTPSAWQRARSPMPA